MFNRRPTTHEDADMMQRNWYSVIVENMNPIINETTIIPTIFVFDDMGQKILRPDGKSYVSRYVYDNYLDTLRTEPVYKWQTPQDILNSIKADEKTTAMITAIKHIINTKPSAISWHNGETDQTCEHHGYHLHILTCQTTNEPNITQTYPYIQLQTAVRQANAELKSQKVKLKPNFSRYMVKTFGGCNNNTMKSLIFSNMDRPRDITPPLRVQLANAPAATAARKKDPARAEHGSSSRLDT